MTEKWSGDINFRVTRYVHMCTCVTCEELQFQVCTSRGPSWTEISYTNTEIKYQIFQMYIFTAANGLSTRQIFIEDNISSEIVQSSCQYKELIIDRK